ncbi:MAG: hypothetical protein IT370_37190 [Deltaproteobacteria bacterium]|nr:hypothetical protein [Deltaproteobacteria bacterium]
MPHRDALEAALMRIRALEQELAEKAAAAAPQRPPPPDYVPPPSLFKAPLESSGAILEELLEDAPVRAPSADMEAAERDMERAFELVAPASVQPLEPEPPRKPLTPVTAHNLRIALPPGKLPRALASGLSCPACTDIGALEELALTETYVEARETLRLLACPACASIYGLRQPP